MIVLLLILVAAFAVAWWQLRLELPLVLATAALGAAILARAAGAVSLTETLVELAFYGLVVALVAVPLDNLVETLRSRRRRRIEGEASR